jgi:hypothetical protein
VTEAASGSISERVWEFGFSFSPAVHGWDSGKESPLQSASAGFSNGLSQDGKDAEAPAEAGDNFLPSRERLGYGKEDLDTNFSAKTRYEFFIATKKFPRRIISPRRRDYCE